MDTINAPMLRRIAEHIRKRPELHDQDTWCGTAQCVAGWAITFEAKDRGMSVTDFVNHRGGCYFDIGQDILRLSNEDAGVLFYADSIEPDWPEALEAIADGENVFDTLYDEED